MSAEGGERVPSSRGHRCLGDRASVSVPSHSPDPGMETSRWVLRVLVTLDHFPLCTAAAALKQAAASKQHECSVFAWIPCSSGEDVPKEIFHIDRDTEFLHFQVARISKNCD